MGDLGGLFSALGPLCAGIVTLFQYRGSYMYLASTMLKNPVRPDDFPGTNKLDESKLQEAKFDDG